MGRMRHSMLWASCAGALLLTGCEHPTAPATLLPAYRAVSVDGDVLPVVIAQSSTTDIYLIGEFLELDGQTDRAWRTMFVVRRDRATGAALTSTLSQVQAYQRQRVGSRVVLRPATPCLAIVDCSSPDTLFFRGATARLRAAGLGRRELRYVPAENPFAFRAP